MVIMASTLIAPDFAALNCLVFPKSFVDKLVASFVSSSLGGGQTLKVQMRKGSDEIILIGAFLLIKWVGFESAKNLRPIFLSLGYSTPLSQDTMTSRIAGI